MEDGELNDHGSVPVVAVHNERVQNVQLPSRSQPLCRLLVGRTSVIPSKHRVVPIDGYPAVQLGRDASIGSTTPRVRLREMEVSKYHANIYWDSSRKEWSIVDMGSKHGTFLSSPFAVGTSIRLSAPRNASLPRQLRHLDNLTIGSTTFVVHLHSDGLPCTECTLSGAEDQVPLFSTKKHIPQLNTAAYSATSSKDSKTALSTLKRTLLAHHHDMGDDNASTEYLDRSAKRRALHPTSAYDSPGVAPLHISLPSSSTPESFPIDETPPAPQPLSPTNVGHRLLMKQGWHPGSTLGVLPDDEQARIALVEPLQIVANTHRAGLGRTVGGTWDRFQRPPA